MNTSTIIKLLKDGKLDKYQIDYLVDKDTDVNLLLKFLFQSEARKIFIEEIFSMVCIRNENQAYELLNSYPELFEIIINEGINDDPDYIKKIHDFDLKKEIKVLYNYIMNVLKQKIDKINKKHKVIVSSEFKNLPILRHLSLQTIDSYIQVTGVAEFVKYVKLIKDSACFFLVNSYGALELKLIDINFSGIHKDVFYKIIFNPPLETVSFTPKVTQGEKDKMLLDFFKGLFKQYGLQAKLLPENKIVYSVGEFISTINKLYKETI